MRVCHVSASASPSVACLCLFVWTSVCGLRSCPAAAALRAARLLAVTHMCSDASDAAPCARAVSCEKRVSVYARMAMAVWPYVGFPLTIPVDRGKGGETSNPRLFARFVRSSPCRAGGSQSRCQLKILLQLHVTLIH